MYETTTWIGADKVNNTFQHHLISKFRKYDDQMNLLLELLQFTRSMMLDRVEKALILTIKLM